MDEFNSKYTGEEIESKLDGAIVFNKDMNLSEEEKARARRNIGADENSGGGGGGAQETQIEPATADIPKVFIDGMIPTTKDDVFAEMQYISKTESFHAFLKIKCQGSSSMSYPKKNFTVKLYSDEARNNELKKVFKDWRHESNKYVLKANYIDHSHARNIVCARLWDEVVSSRADYASLPAEMRNSPRNGAIDGFPIKLYTNGTYQGIYTWNIGKDAWMWGMDEDNANHVLLCGEVNNNGEAIDTATNFRALWQGENIWHWGVEVGERTDIIASSMNALISCVKDTDDNTFKATIGNYLDIQSAIDYWVHQYIICGLDGLAKNMLLATYNGTKWICGAYDMDSTWGLWCNGTSFVPPEYRCPEDYQENRSLLWERISTLFAEEIAARYAELRSSVYSYSNLFTHFERFMDVIGLDLYAEDLTIYPSIPSGNANNIQQIRNFIRDRLYYCDVQFGLIEDNREIDYARDPLAGVTWISGSKYSFSNGELQSSANEYCTPKFKLQDCVYDFNYENAGTYGSIYVWDEEGTFIGYAESFDAISRSTIRFAANSKCEYAIRIQQYETFDPALVSFMPVDNRETMCNTFTLRMAELNWTADNWGNLSGSIDNLATGGTQENRSAATLINSASDGVIKLNDGSFNWKSAKLGTTLLYSLNIYSAWPVIVTNAFGSDIEAAKAYFTNNNTTITFNG